jgi:hypothetical protein
MVAMPKYNFVVCNKRKRIKYPKNFYLGGVEAARQVAVRIALTFEDVVLGWSELSPDRHDCFTIEVMDEAGDTVLSVPFNDAQQSKSQSGRA